MKDIKDYIHLYIGCQVMDLYNNKIGKLIGVSEKEVLVMHQTQWGLTHEEVKPILHRLPRMTKEHKIQVFKVMFPNNTSMNDCGIVGFIDYFLEIPGYEGNSLFDEYASIMPFSSNVSAINWLRKNGFDADGLIDSNLAIDSSTITETNNRLKLLMNPPDGKYILDACCGSRMMWFDKQHPNALFSDIRNGVYSSGHGDETLVYPDVIADFRSMPFEDESFRLVVLDPPHSKWLGENTILGQKYGQLLSTWETDIKAGFDEGMRVLKTFGILIFKWHDKDIKLSKLLSVIGHQPLFGHPSGKHGKTIWLCFMKMPSTGNKQ